MSSNLPVSLFCGGALLKIQALQDGVFAIFPLDVQHGFLDLALTGVSSSIFFLLFRLGIVIGE